MMRSATSRGCSTVVRWCVTTPGMQDFALRQSTTLPDPPLVLVARIGRLHRIGPGGQECLGVFWQCRTQVVHVTRDLVLTAIGDRRDADFSRRTRQGIRHLHREEVAEAFPIAPQPVERDQLAAAYLEAVDAFERIRGPARF